MVKNTCGGNKQKGFARKDAHVSKSKTMLSNDPNELYAKVTKLFGGKICQVITSDDQELKCTIRGKFSGKFKRANLLTVNSFVLVGLHDFNSSNPSCDLLEIYDQSDLSSLPNLHLFDSISSIPSSFNIDFSSEPLHSIITSHTSDVIDNVNVDVNDNDNVILFELI